MPGAIAVSPKFQFFSSAGAPLANGTLTVYLAGTTTNTNTWQDSALSSLNTNPITLDSRGECLLWLDASLSYKFVLKNAGGVTQYTVDNISGASSAQGLAASTGASLVGFIQAGAGAVARTLQAKMRDVVSVKDFDVTGDGVANDTTKVQAALNSGAKRVILPGATTCLITAELSVPSDVEFCGEGDTSVIKLGANCKAIRMAGRSNVHVHDLKIDGQRATYTTNSNNAIDVDWTTTAGSNIKITNVTVRDVAGAGVIALASSGTASSGLMIENCDIKNTGTHGIIAQDYISDVSIRRNRVEATGLGTSDRPGITASRFGARAVISDNICIGSASSLGTSVHGISIDRCSNVTCTGNVVHDWKGYGIEVGGLTNGSVAGNSISSCDRAAIGLTGSNGTFRNTNVAIVGNACDANASQGIYSFMTGAVATYLHQNITVANNIINGTTAQAGIQMEMCDGLTVTGNIVRASFLSGIYLADCLRAAISGNSVIYNNCTAVKSVSSITLAASTATVTSTAHGYANSDVVTIMGAVPAEYNGSFTITNVTANTFDYTTSSGLTSPAVGTIECSKANSTSHGGIRVLYSVITAKVDCVFGQNMVERNAFRDHYDVSFNGPIGFFGDFLILKESLRVPRAENLTSGAASNERDRLALVMKNNRVSVAYNNAGTTNYATLDLDGADTAWSNSATAP